MDKDKKQEYAQPQEGIEEKVAQLNTLMVGVVIVLFIGFAAMFGTIATLVISRFDDSQSSYQDLKDQINSLDENVNHLIENQPKP